MLKRYFLVLCSIMFLTMPSIAAASEASVDAIAVSVRSVDAAPPAKVLKRMELSVATVGEHVLMGRRLSDIDDNKASYEKLIQEVFDRVLVGYSVRQVTITPGTTAQLAVEIAPWGDVVREVRLDIDFGSVSAGAIALIRQDIAGLDDRIQNVLIGLPVDSVDWAGGVSKSVIRELLAAQLPEFRSNIEIIGGPVTVVKLALVPAGPVVRDVRATLRSRSIPNLLLFEVRPVAEEAAACLRGLPVAFVERHGNYFKGVITSSVAGKAAIKRYGLKLDSQLNAGPDTEIVISAETTKYKVTLEGYLDIGRTVDDTSAKLHVGKFVGKRDEVFLETTFIPSSMAWRFAPGWGHRLGAKTEAGFRYDIKSNDGVLWLKQDLGGNWQIRLERTPGAGTDQFAVRYRLHEFLSAEYIFTNDDRWLRLVGNL